MKPTILFCVLSFQFQLIIANGWYPIRSGGEKTGLQANNGPLVDSETEKDPLIPSESKPEAYFLHFRRKSNTTKAPSSSKFLLLLRLPEEEEAARHESGKGRFEQQRQEPEPRAPLPGSIIPVQEQVKQTDVGFDDDNLSGIQQQQQVQQQVQQVQQQMQQVQQQVEQQIQHVQQQQQQQQHIQQIQQQQQSQQQQQQQQIQQAQQQQQQHQAIGFDDSGSQSGNQQSVIQEEENSSGKYGPSSNAEGRSSDAGVPNTISFPGPVQSSSGYYSESSSGSGNSNAGIKGQQSGVKTTDIYSGYGSQDSRSSSPISQSPASAGRNIFRLKSAGGKPNSAPKSRPFIGFAFPSSGVKSSVSTLSFPTKQAPTKRLPGSSFATIDRAPQIPQRPVIFPSSSQSDQGLQPRQNPQEVKGYTSWAAQPVEQRPSSDNCRCDENNANAANSVPPTKGNAIDAYQRLETEPDLAYAPREPNQEIVRFNENPEPRESKIPVLFIGLPNKLNPSQ